MKKLALALGALAILGGALALPISAAEESTVNATVMPILISLNVSPTAIGYGSKPLGATNVTPDSLPIAVTNTGSVDEKFLIRGAPTANWTLAATAGANQYVHKFSLQSGGTYTTLTTTNQTLFPTTPGQGVIPTGSLDLFLRMDLPTSSTVFTQQTASVTIVAALP